MEKRLALAAIGRAVLSFQLIAFLAFLILSVGVLSTSDARAQGVIIPDICRRPPRCIPPIRPLPPRPLPNRLQVKSINFETKITAQVATTKVEQTFRNDTDFTLEGTYFFPIPDSASVSGFAIWENDKKLVGEVRSREQARRIYDSIVRRQRDPGLLEYAGKNLFQASVFPIPPHSDKRLELTYTQILNASNGTIAYRYPLGTGKNADAIFNQNGNAATAKIAGRITIENREAIRNIYSPSHAIDVIRTSAGKRASVSFEQASAGERQDFQLFYTLTADDFGMTLLTHREPTKDGYFLLMVSPPEDNESDASRRAVVTPRDIVFVLDTSGSMQEAGKMEKARAALLFGLRSLRSEDRFNVVAFAGEEKLMSANLIEANDAGRARGTSFVERLNPSGGTNIAAALEAAQNQFANLRDDSRLQMIVFMTDGLPTVGETDVEKITKQASARRENQNQQVRLFNFGVGYDVNTTLLDKLAAETGGAADYVEPKENLEVKVSSFFTKVSFPVLTNLRLETAEVETDLLYPRRLPDLFRGTQLTLIGRYKNAGDVRAVNVKLRGTLRGQEKVYEFREVNFPREESDNDFLPRLWATRRTGWLMEQIRSNGENREVRDEIIDLGTRYGIVTPYTSFLAIEGEAVSSNNFTSIQALPINGRNSSNSNANLSAADAMKMQRTAPSSAPAAAPSVAAAAKTGAVAVRESKRARAQQDAVTVSDNETMTANVRRVREKTFLLNEGVWIDTAYKASQTNYPARETKLVFASEQYFALLKQKPELAAYFALGEAVIVELNGEVYRVAAK